MDLPEYCTPNDDGSVTVQLARGVDLSGNRVKALTMREPTVGDQIVASAAKGDDATREVALFANLCGATPAEIKALTMRDYTRLQAAYRAGFLD